MSLTVGSVFIGTSMLSGALGAGDAAASQRSSLNFSAGISDINARMAEQAAQSELLRGEREYGNARLRTAALRGRQRASLAANGVDLGVGSAAQIQTSTEVMGEIDANTIQANAIKTAWGHRMEATNHRNDALMKRTSASGIDPDKAVFSSLVSGAGRIYGMSQFGGMGGGAGQGAAAGSTSATAATRSDDSVGVFWGQG
jgi:hypothetical protein